MPNLDPAAPNVFAAAVLWLDGTLLGSAATMLSVLAVALVGFLLMSGRIDVRRAVRVIAGCFVLFGASSITAGIVRSLESDMRAPEAVPVPPALPLYPAAAARTAAPAVHYDPYAGAALPTH